MSGWICVSGDVLVLEPCCLAEVRATSAGAPHPGTAAVGGPSSRGRGSGSAVPDPKAVVAFLPRACPSTGLQLPPPGGRTGAQVFAKSRDLAPVFSRGKAPGLCQLLGTGMLRCPLEGLEPGRKSLDFQTSNQSFSVLSP